MKSYRTKGGGNVQLHVVETGNSQGRPILFIHGFSQSWLAWSRQMNSTLAADCRLVAMDVRGHGLSDKPRDGYGDSRMWADDVHAIIQSLSLDHPILCGWSYGPLVILDYIRHYGEDSVGGLHFIGGITKLGTEEAMSVISKEFLDHIPGLFSTDVVESVRTIESFLRLCYGPDLAPEDLYPMLGYNASVPPSVRQALFSRSFDNDDLLPKIRRPLLITHAASDPIVKPSVVDQVKGAATHAQIHMMPGASHACFWSDATEFNRRLQAFAESLS
jgi:non-heme chloroperoxidase